MGAKGATVQTGCTISGCCSKSFVIYFDIRRSNMFRIRRFFAILFIFTALPGISLFANTSITGAYGYFTMPITSTPEKGTVHINAGYIFDPGNIYVSFNTAVLPNWELSAGKEILTEKGRDIGVTPFIFGSKYVFYGAGTGGFRAAAGIQAEFMSDAAGVDGTPISIYAAISESAGKLGYMNTGLGYTFGVDAGYLLNFFFGIRKPIYRDKLYVIGEFTNYSVRKGLGLAWDEQRGVFNTGLLYELNQFFTFKVVGYDLLDHFLTVGIGAEASFKAF